MATSVFSAMLCYNITSPSPVTLHKSYLQYTLDVYLNHPEHQHSYKASPSPDCEAGHLPQRLTRHIWATEVGDVTVVCFKPFNSCSSGTIQWFGSSSSASHSSSNVHLPLQNIHMPWQKIHPLFRQTTNKSIGMQLIKKKDEEFYQSSISLNQKITSNGFPYK